MATMTSLQTHQFPREIQRLLEHTVPIGQRDNTAFELARLCTVHHLSPGQADLAANMLWDNTERSADPRDNFGLWTIQEKIVRLSNQPMPIAAAPTSNDLPRVAPGEGAFPEVNLKSPLEAALAYLRAGIAVVPGCWPTASGECAAAGASHGAHCASPGKHTLLSGWKEFQKRLPTEAEVIRWWKRWPEANILLITGSVSNLVVMDIDKARRFEDNPRRGDWLQNTPVVKTAHGYHVYFRGKGKIKAMTIPNVGDFQGEGKMVIAPPSTHASGWSYQRIDQAGPNILELVSGAENYLIEAFSAPRPQLVKHIGDHEIRSHLPDHLLNWLRERGEKVWDSLNFCRYFWVSWRCEGQPPHTEHKRKPCNVSSCPHMALDRARRFVDEHKKRIEGYQDPTEISIPINLPIERAKEALADFRHQAQRHGVSGDLALVPTGEVTQEGAPLYAISGVTDGPGGFQATESAAPLYVLLSVATVRLTEILWHAYSGAALWKQPEAWLRWQTETKGSKIARGIEDGRRTPVKKPREKREHLCPHCGKPMHMDRTKRYITNDEIERLLAAGKAIKTPDGSVAILAENPGVDFSPPS